MFKFISLIVISLTISQIVVCTKFDPVIRVQNTSNGNLQEDLNEFLNLVPVDDIRNLTEFFYANDGEMRQSYDYLRDEGFKLVVENISKLSLVKKFITFLNDSGVDFAESKKRIEKIVLTSEEAKSIVVNDETEGNMGGMNAFFSEALSLIPQDEVLSLLFVKMEESNSFSSFLEKLNASDYENITDNLKKSQGIQEIYFAFHAHGIDIMEWAKSLRSFFGY
ncbi:CLUMA_CG013421, isoform A [Clunio marinus]|uniref:CLUMA_CG013421, isoform A n=1 Tax=Clunio marinus TaxID=568069 RepID=A0A1J1INT7_9DIPT|nr:CLUMA_CG013421, isoform A [Clunio marinus]